MCGLPSPPSQALGTAPAEVCDEPRFAAEYIDLNGHASADWVSTNGSGHGRPRPRRRSTHVRPGAGVFPAIRATIAPCRAIPPHRAKELKQALKDKNIEGVFELPLGTTFQGSFRYCDFHECRIEGGSFRGSVFDHCRFRDVRFVGVCFDDVTFYDCAFPDVEFEGCSTDSFWIDKRRGRPPVSILFMARRDTGE